MAFSVLLQLLCSAGPARSGARARAADAPAERAAGGENMDVMPRGVYHLPQRGHRQRRYFGAVRRPPFRAGWAAVRRPPAAGVTCYRISPVICFADLTG